VHRVAILIAMGHVDNMPSSSLHPPTSLAQSIHDTLSHALMMQGQNHPRARIERLDNEQDDEARARVVEEVLGRIRARENGGAC